MGAAALAVLLIVGVSLVAWHFTKQERCPDNSLGVSGCSGKMIVEVPFKRGDIEKVDTDGFSQHWNIKANSKKD